MAEVVEIVRTCIKVAQKIYGYKKQIEIDNQECSVFFYRLEILQDALDKIASNSSTSLNLKRADIVQLNEALNCILNVLEQRERNSRTPYGIVYNAFTSVSGHFSKNLDYLHTRLDRCMDSVNLYTVIDMSVKMNDVVAKFFQESSGDSVSLFMNPPSEDNKRVALGEGTFGVTYKMINGSDKCVYAVKEINVMKAQALGIRKRELAKEATLLQGMSHPYIVRYFTSFFSAGDEVFNIVMELMEGGSLADKIDDRSVTVRQIGRWLQQLASALEYLHVEKDIQHRDIKPENIMLTLNGKIKLIDLGSATAISSVASKMTKIGTMLYFSYEKAHGIFYDGRDDVWAAGCVFAELLTRSRLSDRGGAIYLYTNEDVTIRRLTLIEDCKSRDEEVGYIIECMLHPEQQHRMTSSDLKALAVSIDIELLSSKSEKSRNSHESKPPTPSVKPTGMLTKLQTRVTNYLGIKAPRGTSRISKAVLSAVHWSYKRGASVVRSNVNILAAAAGFRKSDPISHWTEPTTHLVHYPINAISCSPASPCIAIGGDNQEIRLIDLDSKQPPRFLNVCEWVECLCFDPDGTMIAAGLYGNVIKVFEAETLQFCYEIIARERVFHVAYNGNGSKLVASVGFNSLLLIDARGGTIIDTLDVPASLGLSFSADGNLLATAGDENICIIETLSRPRLWLKRSGLSCICIAPNGLHVFAGTTSGDIEIFCTNSGISVQKFRADMGRISSLSFNCDGKWFVSGSNGHGIKVWDATKKEEVQCLNSIEVLCSGITVTNCVAFASIDMKVSVWECPKLQGEY